MMKIWGRANSANVKKVLWIAGELELDYERIDVGGPFGGLSDPAYLAKNPNGLIPLLEDDGALLWESNTIVRYLAARHSGKGLWIEDPLKRAEGEKWMDWASTTFARDFSAVMMNLIRLPEEKRNPALVEQGWAALTRAVRIPEEALGRQNWLSGESFGIGDIPLGSFIHGWFQLPLERPAVPNIENWYKRLKERPAYLKTVATPLT
ncbi:MAG: glutathione S-transferase [Rhizobiales bacterium]|nr:glutathione S-transferase [Hyphomicrobiales bacterium]OJX99257.1 MAG: glutathione S-transferase [Rhizobiales bacterium 63-22]